MGNLAQSSSYTPMVDPGMCNCVVMGPQCMEQYETLMSNCCIRDGCDYSKPLKGSQISLDMLQIRMPGRGLINLDTKKATSNSGPKLAAYYQTWSSSCTWYPAETTQCDLADIVPYVDQVFLSFADPNLVYEANDPNSIGLQFNNNMTGTFKRSVEALRVKNPNVEIFVSVGGATFPFPDRMSTPVIQGLMQFCNDNNLDGIDLDYENDPNCSISSNGVVCETDTQLTMLIQDFGIHLAMNNAQTNGKKLKLVAAPFSVGAYGQQGFMNSKPLTSHGGMWVNPLQAAGHYLDILNLMTYDAGPYTFKDTSQDPDDSLEFNPLESYAAYKKIFSGKINVGIETPPEAWGGNKVTEQDIAKVAQTVAANGDGLMLWSLQKTNQNPSTREIIEWMCKGLSKGDICTNDGQTQAHTLPLRGTLKEFHTHGLSQPGDFMVGPHYCNKDSNGHEHCRYI